MLYPLACWMHREQIGFSSPPLHLPVEDSMPYMKLLGLIILASTYCSSALCEERAKDSTQSKVEKARSTFQSETEKLNTSVLGAMEKRVELVRKQGDKDALDVLNTEIKRFESGGPMPSFLPEAYHKKQIVMLQRVGNALEAAQKDYTKKGKDAEAESLSYELKAVRNVLQFIEVRRTIVGTWRMTAGCFGADVVFYADGTAHTSTLHKCTWEFDAEKQQLTWTYPHGLQEMVKLPIDPRGTKGVSSVGTEIVITKK